MVDEGERLRWLNFDLLEMFRYGGDGRALRDLTDRQLRDAGIDLSQAGRGRAASPTWKDCVSASSHATSAAALLRPKSLW